MIYRAFFKRVFDVVVASIALIVLALPLFFAIAAIRITSPGPVFYFQQRVGLNGKTFKIIKLRSMTINPDRVARQTTNNDPEVFPVGRLLRRLKIDELPQLLNILIGEMSVVGPRPCLEETRDKMPEWAQNRFTVRPGLTGLAQTNGNIALSWEKRWEQDILYVDRLSFPLDVWLVIKTVLVVILGEEKFGKTA